LFLTTVQRSIGTDDWGSSVFGKIDEQGHFVSQNIMGVNVPVEICSKPMRVCGGYFILLVKEQLNGRFIFAFVFHEQGLASTILP